VRPAPVPPDRPIHVHVTVQPGPWYDPRPEPEPALWDRIRGVLRRLGHPWKAAAALTGAFFPIPPGGYSLATTWWWIVGQTRHYYGAPAGYALGLGALAAAGALLAYRPGLIRLCLVAITFVGAFGAFSWWDPITALTGVTR
jgi:hypothetical protein